MVPFVLQHVKQLTAELLDRSILTLGSGRLELHRCGQRYVEHLCATERCTQLFDSIGFHLIAFTTTMDRFDNSNRCCSLASHSLSRT